MVPAPASELHAASRAQVREAQRVRLLELLREVARANAFYRSKLSGLDLGAHSALPLEAILDTLPFTTKDELVRDQEAVPPFGTNRTHGLERYTRLHQTSGTTGRPLRWLDTPESWEWFLRGWTEVYRGAGITAADRVFFPFSFGPFIGFWAAFECAARLGALAIPAGGLKTSARLRLLADTGATVVAATPTYALRMAEVARAEGIDLSRTAVRALIVAGEPGGSIASTRARLEEAWGARVFDHCGMTEAGPIAFECAQAPGGLHAIESEMIIEVVEPGGSRRAPPDPGTGTSAGELVVTNLGRVASPVVRYRTGDWVRLDQRPCPCGRPWSRLEGGLLGRLDEMVFVRGNNVYPAAIEAIIRRFPQVGEYRATVRQSGALARLEVELELDDTAPGAGDGSGQAPPGEIAAAIERELLFQADVRSVPRGTLPRFELKAKRFFKDNAAST